MNEYSKMTDNQVVSSIARKWSGSALDATKTVKDAEQPRPHDLSEYDLDHKDGLRFWEGFVIGLACGIAVFAILVFTSTSAAAHGGTPTSWHGTPRDLHPLQHRGGAHLNRVNFGQCEADWAPGFESPLIVHRSWHGMTQTAWHE